MLVLTFAICFIAAILMTPLIIKLAHKVGATDKPNNRKVHQKLMPRLGGLAIYIAFMIGFLIVNPNVSYANAIVIAGFIIIVTGVLDDIYELSAKYKLLGQLAAALVIVLMGGIEVTYITLPFEYKLHFGILSIPLTIFWIIGITNAINLIDGLDGLAAGVSSIALLTITGMALSMGDIFVASMGLILLGSTLGFLVFNFHPAKIFMGDTGALFLGFMISVLSLLGFKNITLLSFLVPIIILGVPISDTFFAILRRLLNKKPLSAPDKSHLHHCLLRNGYSHKQSVLIIYAIASFFALSAVLFSSATMWGSLLVVSILVILIEIFAEKVGLVDKNYRPLLNFVRGLRMKMNDN
ncbi:glycosyltransferase family 4 protein [Sutcliffiella horikoshii]|uniref:glycosyltransferase family 4 protein n=1 Tax=Sutcliffiella horikoshii TaxID=79883 RepID=UPI00384A83BF